LLPEVNISAPIANAEVSVSIAAITSGYFRSLENILSSVDTPIIIVIDEFTVLLEFIFNKYGLADVKMFMSQLRALRMATSENCSWVICSSVGVRNFASIHKLSSTINDLYDFTLGPFSNDEADKFIEELCGAIGKQISAENRQYLLAKIGWPLPYFIQLIISRIEQDVISEESIDQSI